MRVVEVLERDGEGLNLTVEVRDGMLNHQMKSKPFTLEGRIVRFSDKLAYIHHDMDDAIRAKVLKDSDVPKEIGDVLGYHTKERLDHLIHNIIATSLDKDDILMEPYVERAMLEMRAFMFKNVYQNPIVKAEESKAESLVKTLYEYYVANKDKLPEEYKRLMDRGESIERVACDFIASMTDHFAIATYEELYIPKSWHG